MVFPQVHWCFSMNVSYTTPAPGRHSDTPGTGPPGTPTDTPPPGGMGIPWDRGNPPPPQAARGMGNPMGEGDPMG